MDLISYAALGLLVIFFIFSWAYTFLGIRVITCPNNKCRAWIIVGKNPLPFECECTNCSQQLIIYPNYLVKIKNIKDAA